MPQDAKPINEITSAIFIQALYTNINICQQ